MVPKNMKDSVTKVPKEHQLNTQRMIMLRYDLYRELLGYKTGRPTAYYRIKKEFQLTGSRKKVLEQFTALIEERLHE